VRRAAWVAGGIGVLAIAAVAAAVVIGRSGGSDGFAGSASELCDDARGRIDDLGDPSDRGLGVLLERVEIGEQLVEDLDELEPDEGQEQEDEALVFAYRNYYRSLRLGYDALRKNQGSALKALDEAARRSRSAAEAAAEAIAATGCAAST
jgi:hypothetical protein